MMSAIHCHESIIQRHEPIMPKQSRNPNFMALSDLSLDDRSMRCKNGVKASQVRLGRGNHQSPDLLFQVFFTVHNHDV